METEEKRNPPRNRKKPGYLSEYSDSGNTPYVTDGKKDKLLMNTDDCYSTVIYPKHLGKQWSQLSPKSGLMQ